MRTLAIIGAGPGLGFSLAKKFGQNGFNIALVSRTKDRLDGYSQRLSEMGIEAKGFAADITCKSQLTQAIERIEDTYGGIDVLEYSPHSGNMPVTSILDCTEESVTQAFQNIVIGAINSVTQVLPGMLHRGEGALLFTTDLSAMSSNPMFGNTGISMSGLRNYALGLQNKLFPKGIYVGHLSISPLIRRGSNFDPDLVADAWYNMYEQKMISEATFPQNIIKHFS